MVVLFGATCPVTNRLCLLRIMNAVKTYIGLADFLFFFSGKNLKICSHLILTFRCLTCVSF